MSVIEGCKKCPKTGVQCVKYGTCNKDKMHCACKECNPKERVMINGNCYSKSVLGKSTFIFR